MIELGDLELSDVGPLKRVELSLRRQGLVLLRGENRDTTAADSNGVGKSWVLKGLSWGLFGDTVDAERTDEVVRRGALKAQARVSIHEPSGPRWDVIRTRSKSGVKLEILQDGKPATGAIVRDSQASINKLLGMDFQTFRNTVMFGQGDTARFAAFDAPETERKAVLKNIMRVTIIDRAAKFISEQNRLQDARGQQVQRLIDIAGAKLSGVSTERLDEEILNLKARKLELSKEFKNLPRLQKMEKEVQTLLDGYKAKKLQITAEKDKRAKLQASVLQLQGKVNTERYKLAEVNKQLALFNGGKCPLCTTPASGEHVKTHLAQLRQNGAAAGKAIKNLEAESNQHSGAAARCIAGIRVLEAEVVDETDWNGKLLYLQTQIRSIEQNKREVSQIDADVGHKAEQRSGAAKQLKALNAELKIHGAELEQIESDQRHFAFWQRGFGNQGLPSYVIDSIIPELTANTNFWLDILSDGDITVEFDTQSKLKSGEVRDRFAMNTIIEGVDGTRPSGGQGQKIMIASSLGLADVVASREHAALDLACLDEILDGLDSSGKARITDLLVELRKKRSTILVVSHDPAITEMFEKVITLVKEGGSTVVH